MAAQSIAWYQRRIKELEEAEDLAYTTLGSECLAHARTRQLAARLAGLLVKDAWSPEAAELLGQARKAGLL